MAEERPEIGAFRIDRRIGSGGMGVVYLAESPTGRRVALKVVRPEYAADEAFRARFAREVAAARAVSGAFTASVVDADAEAETPWLATEFIDAPTLAEVVKRDGPLRADQLWSLAYGLAEALRDIHRVGVVHRDLKPSNVLMAPDGPKVIDFGISRGMQSSHLTTTGKMIGTPPYMAPEQFQAPGTAGPAADVFALGAVLAFAGTGVGPFDSDSPYVVAYKVVHREPDLDALPQSVRDLAALCLAKDPARRPDAGRILAVLGSPEPRGDLTVPAQQPWRRRPSRRQWLGAGVAVALLAAAATGGVLMLDRPSARSAAQGAGPTGGAKGGASGPFVEPTPGAGRLGWARWETPIPGGSAGSESRTMTCVAVPEDGVICHAEGQVLRLDARTGRLLWVKTVPRPLDPGRGDDIAVAGDVVVTVSLSSVGVVEEMTGLDALSGSVRWHRTVHTPALDLFQVEGGPAGLPVVVVDTRAVRGVDPRTGRERWEVPAAGIAANPVAVTDTTVVALQFDPQRNVGGSEGIDRATGRIVWRSQHYLRAAQDLLVDASHPSEMFVSGLGSDGVTVGGTLLDVGTGRTTAVSFAEHVRGPMAVGDGMVVAARDDGVLVAFREDTGRVAWRQRLPGGASSVLAFVGGPFCGVLVDSRVYCVDAATGRLLWVGAARQAADLGVGGDPLQIAPARVGSLWVAGTLRGTVVALAPPSD
ncbi:Serine/threonine protein kinase [Streptacidiphilus jiangxiensis]|uniref:Serine/threonine protein kinase n=1 Tax=Streptacidiphilus jiangxiensis TaxID=235985 RepID=A0A1H7SJG8_STRJI|nr:Serine/threonine protein kinase [Streptacidiphilus jiangxiensis]